MPPRNRLPSPDSPPKVNPDDVATYLELRLKKSGTFTEIAAAKRVDDAMKVDSAVRAYVEELLRLEDPTLHPEHYPSTN